MGIPTKKEAKIRQKRETKIGNLRTSYLQSALVFLQFPSLWATKGAFGGKPCNDDVAVEVPVRKEYPTKFEKDEIQKLPIRVYVVCRKIKQLFFTCFYSCQ